jgi:hypothetical protein
MKTGDKIRVINNDYDNDTNIQIGTIGTIISEDESNANYDLREYDIFNIKFGDEITFDEFCADLNEDGTYKMFRCQLEVIEE